MKKYQLIYADPPWSYQNWTEKKNGAAKSHYKQLKIKDLCNLPVGNIAEDNSILLLWATFPKLDEAMEVMSAWGFKYITAPVVRPHSTKPLETYDRIQELFGDVSRIELFARKQQEGWDVVGNEIDGKDIRDVIK